MGPLGNLSAQCEKWAARTDPFFSVWAAFWGPTNMNVESCEEHLGKTDEPTKNACCLQHVFFGDVLLVEGKVHITKVHFFKICPLHF